MRRTGLLRRTPLRRSSTPVGAAARERRKAGGPRATGRPSLSSAGYERLRQLLLIRADGRCEACGSRNITGELEHAVPRSAGGSDDYANVWCCCRNCHRAKEAPYSAPGGRLVVSATGTGIFTFQRFGGSKWAPVALGTAWSGGRLPTAAERAVLATLV